MKTTIDKCYQLFLIVAYRILLCYWYIRRPQTKGVYVAVWYNNHILIIKNSYKHDYSFPGGGIEKRETLAHAAARELKEETGLLVPPGELRLAGQIEHQHEFKRDRVYFVETFFLEKPTIRVDQREVTWGSFMEPNTALKMDISPLIRWYLTSRETR